MIPRHLLAVRAARRIGLLTLVCANASVAQARPDVEALADQVFIHYTRTGPGCVVGVAQGGQVLLERAYGAADLEQGVPLVPTSILEAGSVAKQFTAAAVTLLALDGKLRFKDDIRKYFPELPVYERPITVRMLLDHTSGLRDWGAIAGIEGWPRGTRAHTQAHALAIIARQRALNYPPGDRYSYTNSGYSLLAMLVARVSRRPFAEFTRERLFLPLGMNSTSWRDDFQRIVPGRAPAYEPVGGGWRLDMPFEDVHGNGGLLTTVGDLLRWNAALTARTLGGALVDSLQRQGVLTSGERIEYAAGVRVSEYRGTHRIAHSGSTAGYRAYLARYPEQHELSIAVLCNTHAPATALAQGMVDGLAEGLTERASPVPAARPAAAWKPTMEQLTALVGEYESAEVGVTLSVVLEQGRLRVRRRPSDSALLVPSAADGFVANGFGRIWFTPDGVGGATRMHVGVARAFDVVFSRAP